MYSKTFSKSIRPAGIETKAGEHIDHCLNAESDFNGPEVQRLYRNRLLGPPGEKLRPPGIIDEPLPQNMVFGIETKAKNGTSVDCIKSEPTYQSPAYQRFLTIQDPSLRKTKEASSSVCFGKPSEFSETMGDVVHQTHQDIPKNSKYEPGRQVSRSYVWSTSRINPVTHTFGIKSEGNVDHLSQTINSFGNNDGIVPLAVDRLKHNATVPDPDPLKPKERIILKTKKGIEVKSLRDPIDLPPAGKTSLIPPMSVGDTFQSMGLMDSIGPECSKPKEWNPAYDKVHGIKTRIDRFPDPFKGPGRYASIGLSENDFIELREKSKLVPVMVRAFGISEDEATSVFNSAAAKLKRDRISVAEYHQEYHQKNNLK